MVEGKLIHGEKSEAAGRAWSMLWRLCLRKLFHKIYRTLVKFSISFYFFLWIIKYLSIACYQTIRGEFVLWQPFKSQKQQICLESFNMTLSHKFPMSLNTSLINIWHPYFYLPTHFNLFNINPKFYILLKMFYTQNSILLVRN